MSLYNIDTSAPNNLSLVLIIGLEEVVYNVPVAFYSRNPDFIGLFDRRLFPHLRSDLIYGNCPDVICLL